MTDLWFFLARFYGLLFAAVILLLLVIVTPKFLGDTTNKVEFETTIHVSFLGFKIPLALWLKRIWVLRTALLTTSVVSMWFALNIDFSEYFPKSFRMDVYFDLRGLERTLGLFSDKDIKDVGITEKWRALVGSYDEEVEKSLEKLWRQRVAHDVPQTDEFSRDLLHARGTATFRAEKVSFLAYRIVESNGHLDFELDIPKKPLRRFRGEFHLRDTAANHLRPSFVALLHSPSVVLRPEFKQVFSIEDGGADAPFDHIVIGLSRVTLLPFPAFSSTLYLWQLQDGSTVPVAYAMYY